MKDKCKKTPCCFDYKVMLIIFCIFTSVVLLIMSTMSYFSDIVTKSEDVVAGTLDIVGEYQLYLNGSTTPITDEDINNFNPGDVLVTKATIVNEGNKSAWIRDVIDFTDSDTEIMNFVKIYEGEKTLQQILDGETPLTLTDNVFTSVPKIIDGRTGSTDRETETGSDALGSDTTNVAYTIYFDRDADNTAQGKTIDLTVKTQVIQYRNNTTTPTDTTWQTVVTTPFSYIP